MECVPYAAGSRPIDATQLLTTRAYCRVDKCGELERRLAKWKCSDFKCAAAILGGDRVARLLGDLKLYRSLGLLLHHDCARRDMTALNHVVDAEPTRSHAPSLLSI